MMFVSGAMRGGGVALALRCDVFSHYVGGDLV